MNNIIKLSLASEHSIKKFEILDSKAPILVKFGYLCAQKTIIPTNLGIFCLILSQLQILGLYFRIVFQYLPYSNSSIVQVFKFFSSLMTVYDMFEFNSESTKLTVLIGIYFALTISSFMIGVLILYFIITKKPISNGIRNFWGIICYFQPLLLFMPIHYGSLRFIKDYKYSENENQIIKSFVLFSFLTLILNFLLAFLNSIIFYSMMKTQDILSSKTSKLRRCELLIKTTVPTLMLIETSEALHILTCIMVMSSLVYFKILANSLPYYNKNILLIVAYIQSVVGILSIIILVTILGSRQNLDSNFVVIMFLLLSPISLKIVHEKMNKIFSRCLFADIECLSPEMITQKRYLFQDLLKSQTKLSKRTQNNDFDTFLFHSKISDKKEYGEEYVDQYSKENALKIHARLLEKALELHPNSNLIKLNLALHYGKRDTIILKAYNLLEEVRNTKMTFDVAISFYMVLFRLEEILLKNYSEGNGILIRGNEKTSQLNMMRYISMDKLISKVRNKIIAQGKIHLTFWKIWQEQSPDYKKLSDLAQKAEKHRIKFQNKWIKYQTKIDPSFHDPFLLYGLYMFLVDNRTIEGEILIEKYQKRVLRTNEKKDQVGLINDTLFSSDSFHIYMSAMRSKMGTIMDCSKNIENILGFKREFLIQKPITTIMTPFFRERHAKFISNYAKTGQQKLINQTNLLPCLNIQGYSQTIYIHLKINPLIETGMSYVALMRPLEVDNSQSSVHLLQFRENGILDSISKETQDFLGISAKNYDDNFSVFEICPELWIATQILCKKVYSGRGLEYKIDLSFFKNKLLKFYTKPEKNKTDSSRDYSNSSSHFEVYESSTNTKRLKLIDSTKPKSSDLKYFLEEGHGNLIDPALFDHETELVNLVEQISQFEGYLTIKHRVIQSDNSAKILESKVKCGLFCGYYHDQVICSFSFIEPNRRRSLNSENSLGISIGSLKIHCENKLSNPNQSMQMMNNLQSDIVFDSNLSSFQNDFKNSEVHGNSKELKKQITFGENNSDMYFPGEERNEMLNYTIDNYNFGPSHQFPDLHLKESFLNSSLKITDKKESAVKSEETAEDEKPVKRNHAFKKVFPIIRRIIHTKKSLAANKKKSSLVQEHEDQVILLKTKLRRRMTLNFHRGPGNPQNSISSTVSRISKFEPIVQRVLELNIEEKWMKVFKYGFLIVFQLFCNIYFYLYLYVSPKYNEWLHIKNVIVVCYNRLDALLYYDEYIQVLDALLTNFYDVRTRLNNPDIPRALAILVQSFLYSLNDANNEVKFDISTLKDSAQPFYFRNDVEIYDIDFEGNFYYSYNTTAFRAISSIIERGFKTTNYIINANITYEYVKLEEFEFITRNSKNSLLISAFQSLNSLHEQLLEEIHDESKFYKILIYVFITILGIFFLMQVKFCLKLCADSKYFAFIFLKFKTQSILKHEESAKLFIQNLKEGSTARKIVNLDFLSHENLKIGFENEEALKKNTKINRYPNMKKAEHSYAFHFFKIIPFFLLIDYLLLTSIFQLGDDFKSVSDYEKQMFSSLEYLVLQTSIITLILELYKKNGTTTYVDLPVDVLLFRNLESFADITHLLERFRDSSSNQLGKFEQEIFFNLSCNTYAKGNTENYQFCLDANFEKGYVSLVDVSSKLYRLMSLRYEEYSESEKTYEQLQSMFAQTISESNDTIILSRNLLTMLVNQVSEKFDDNMHSNNQKLISDVIIKTLSTLVAGILVWVYIIKPVCHMDFARKCLIKLVPKSILLENRLMKTYLLNHSDEELKSYKNIL